MRDIFVYYSIAKINTINNLAKFIFLCGDVMDINL